MLMTRTASAALTALVTVAAAVALAVVAAAPAGADVDTDAFADQLFERANADRADNGYDELDRDEEMDAIAAEWSQEMASLADDGNDPEQVLGHNPDQGSLEGEWETLLENVAYTAPGEGPDDAHAMLMNSAAHRANLLARVADTAGMGVAVDGEGRVWVTQFFASGRLTGDAPDMGEVDRPEGEDTDAASSDDADAGDDDGREEVAADPGGDGADDDADAGEAADAGDDAEETAAAPAAAGDGELPDTGGATVAVGVLAAAAALAGLGLWLRRRASV